MSNIVHDTSSTGSRLPADKRFSSTPTGLGLDVDPELIAGTGEPALPPRPERAAANDDAFTYGLVAEGHNDGEIDTEREIPWLR